MSTHKICLFIILMMLGGGAKAETDFHHVNSMWGISKTKITSLCMDEEGFVYGASKSGLIRVAEGDCRDIDFTCPPNINQLYLLNVDNVLHIFTDKGGIFRQDPISEQFNLVVDLNDSIREVHFSVNCALEMDSTVYLATTKGLLELQGTDFRNVSPLNKTVYAAKPDGCGNIVYVTSDHIYSFTPATQQIKEICVLPAITGVHSMYVDPLHRQVYIGTLAQGIIKAPLDNNGSTMSFLPGIPSQPIRALTAVADTTLMVGVDGSGIFELSLPDNNIRNHYLYDPDVQSSLKGNGVYDMVFDGEKRLWVSTYTGGISYIDLFNETPIRWISHQSNNPNSLPDYNVNSVFEDSRNRLWFGTDHGATCWNPADDSWTHIIRSNAIGVPVLAINEDPNGDIWLGTYAHGLFIIDGKTFAIKKHNQKAEGNELKFIFDIFQDSRGDMWIGGTSSNVFNYNVKDRRLKVFPHSPLFSFTETDNGQVLANCIYGIHEMDPEHLTYNNIFNKGYIVRKSMLINDVLWIATSGKGLLRYDRHSGNIVEFTKEKSGLPSDDINSMLYTDSVLVIGTENGLCSFNISSHAVSTFPSLPALARRTYNRNAICRLNSGDIALGTDMGAVILNPRKIRKQLQTGKLYFQDLLIAGTSAKSLPDILDKPLNQTEDIKLGHRNNAIAFEFIPIGISANQCRFAWQLEGVDQQWHTIPDQRIAAYNNLRPGKYVFKIFMYNNSFSQILDSREITVTIVPPIWQTWWFYLLVFIVICGLTLFGVKLYLKHLKQVHNEDKIRFFTNMAHDIRTSLTLIKAPIEALTKETGLTTRGKYFLGLADEQVGKLSAVATELLDIEKVDVGKGQFVPSGRDVVAIVRQRVLMYEALAANKQITLSFHTNAEEYVTSVDRVKIEKIIDNLLSNAIKYSPESTAVDIEMHCTPQAWSLTVRDQGIGISDNARKKLFKEFYRGENAVNSGVVGSGIGLLLTKHYVDMHKGSITLESNHPTGSVFTITIPFVTPDSSEAQLPSPDTANVPAAPEAPNPDENSAAKGCLMVVEDNKDLRDMLQQAFSDEYEVISAENGRVAWDILWKKQPDLVISDVMMPEMNGLELCRLIKSTFETAHIPIILLTSLSDKTNQLDGLRLGADDYLLKPFDLTLLNTRIASLIKNRNIIKDKSLKLIGRTSETDMEKPLLNNELNDQFLKKALETAKAHIADNEFSKEDFASEMCVSPSILYKKLKAITGQSPVDFIKSIRLNLAQELLLNTNRTITDISEACGFSSVTYFGIAFKKFYGKSPSEFRNSRG